MTAKAPSLRILVIAAARHPLREPFAGGLEAHTHQLVRVLSQRGHRVTLLAPVGADSDLEATLLPAAELRISEAAAADVNAPPRQWMEHHHIYLSLMLALAGGLGHEFDIVHDNSLHHLPVAMAPAVAQAVSGRGPSIISSLHTPPLPWLESAVDMCGSSVRFTAVSESCRRSWGGIVAADVVRNGVDTASWSLGSGGPEAVWSGRMTPEKAPHEAIAAARLAGIRLRLAGPLSDPRYFDDCVAPLLGPGIEYVGHLSQRDLADLVGASSVALATPHWDEPYGLVAAEAMSCGTPVVAYDRGALREIVPATGGMVVPPGDVAAMAAAIATAQRLPRSQVRATALAHCSIDTMAAGYEALYLEEARRESAA